MNTSSNITNNANDLFNSSVKPLTTPLNFDLTNPPKS